VGADVVVQRRVRARPVLARERERRGDRRALRGEAAREAAALEEQQRRAEVGLGLELLDRRAEQLGARVLAQHRLVPRAEGVHQLVRLGEAAARGRLRGVDEHRPLLEPQRAEQLPPARADALGQRGHRLERAHARHAVQRRERRRQDAEHAGLRERALGDRLQPRLGRRLRHRAAP
jgi:hypothetical protein